MQTDRRRQAPRPQHARRKEKPVHEQRGHARRRGIRIREMQKSKHERRHHHGRGHVRPVGNVPQQITARIDLFVHRDARHLHDRERERQRKRNPHRLERRSGRDRDPAKRPLAREQQRHGDAADRETRHKVAPPPAIEDDPELCDLAMIQKAHGDHHAGDDGHRQQRSDDHVDHAVVRLFREARQKQPATMQRRQRLRDEHDRQHAETHHEQRLQQQTPECPQPLFLGVPEEAHVRMYGEWRQKLDRVSPEPPLTLALSPEGRGDYLRQVRA